MITKICPQCNKQFTTAFKTQKLCSRECAFLSMSRKVELVCPQCSKHVYVHVGTKFCSKACADSARRGIRLRPPVMKVCPVCGNSFESKWTHHQFCSTNCADVGKTKPTIILSEDEKLKRSNKLKQQWQDENFRNMVINRMKINNPVYMPGVVEKAADTRRKNKRCLNNFKYGNGHISPYEQIVMDKLEGLGFVYNHAISTKVVRDTDPDAHYAVNYKPDFTSLENKLCIEIDGAGHSTSKEKLIDAKKERCLNLLGYSIIRFTHEDIDKGVFDQWLNSYQRNI